MSGKSKVSLSERFWSKVQKTDDCWIWKANKSPANYGRINVAGKVEFAHRMAWTLTIGPIPDGMFVLHKCDNPECVNPEHLFVGTQRDNVADMIEKKRNNIGAKNGASKLTVEQITDIRSRNYSRHGSRSVVAREFGICVATMHEILYHKIWRHL